LKFIITQNVDDFAWTRRKYNVYYMAGIKVRSSANQITF
jgi:hypothetical protein